MSGPIARLREWLGSLFGGDDEDGDTAADEQRIEGNAPTVTHRDDRPLETPDVSPPADSVAAPETGTDPGPSGDAPREDPTDAGDAEAATDADPGPVTVPDAEAGMGSESEPGPGPDDLTALAEAGTGEPPDDASAFECAVCGTSVDDPAHSCPLCRSDEVVPVTESPERDS
jgi:hypothetical protein